MKFMKARGIGVYDFCECVGLSTHISTRSRCDRCKFNWSLQTLAPLPPEPWIAPYRHNRHNRLQSFWTPCCRGGELCQNPSRFFVLLARQANKQAQVWAQDVFIALQFHSFQISSSCTGIHQRTMLILHLNLIRKT